MIRIGLVGLGYWGPLYLRILNELNDRCTVTVICDKRREALEKGNRLVPSADATSDLSRLLGEQCDALIVATNAGSHYDVVSACLEKGKDVLVEKPLTLRSDHAKHLWERAVTASSVLMVAHTFIYNDAVRMIKKLIDEGRIGQIAYCEIDRSALGPIRQDVNPIWDLMIHDLSILDYFLGPIHPDQVHGITAAGRDIVQAGIQDVVSASCTLPNGVFVSLFASWLAPVKKRTFQIVGSKGAILFDDVALTGKVTIYERQETSHESIVSYADFISAAKRSGDIITPRVDVREPLKEQVTHFLDCVRDRCNPLSDALSGWRVVSLAERIDRRLKEGK